MSYPDEWNHPRERDYYTSAELDRLRREHQQWRKEMGMEEVKPWRELPHRADGQTLADYVARITEMVADCPRSEVRLEFTKDDRIWLARMGIQL